MRSLMALMLFAVTVTICPADAGFSQSRNQAAQGRNSETKQKKTTNGEIIGTPPKSIRRILSKIAKARIVDLNGNTGKADLSNLSESERSTLDKFAARVAGVTECKIREIYGCQSCYLGDTCRPCHGEICGNEHWGNYVITDCGRQCWHCFSPKC